MKRFWRKLRALLARCWPGLLGLTALGLIAWGAWGIWWPLGPLSVGGLLWLDLIEMGRRNNTNGNT